MDGEGYLYALVEAGVALAGFSAIALALDSRSSHLDDAGEGLIVARLVERSLMGSLFAVLPVLQLGLGVPETIVWFVSSGTLAAYGAYRLVQTLRRRATVYQLGLSRPLTFLLFLVAVVMIVVQVLNAVGLLPSRGFWWYALGVTWLIVTAGYTFVIYLQARLRDRPGS